jgi:hypothetical protein
MVTEAAKLEVEKEKGVEKGVDVGVEVDVGVGVWMCKMWDVKCDV